jgi:hypothetical protein
MNKSIQWTREGPDKIGTILIKSEHLKEICAAYSTVSR